MSDLVEWEFSTAALAVEYVKLQVSAPEVGQENIPVAVIRVTGDRLELCLPATMAI